VVAFLKKRISEKKIGFIRKEGKEQIGGKGKRDKMAVLTVQ
jgi:hypothetical protein